MAQKVAAKHLHPAVETSSLAFPPVSLGLLARWKKTARLLSLRHEHGRLWVAESSPRRPTMPCCSSAEPGNQATDVSADGGGLAEDAAAAAAAGRR